MRPVPESIVGSLAGTSPATLGLGVDSRATGTGLRRIPLRCSKQAGRAGGSLIRPSAWQAPLASRTTRTIRA